MTLVDDVIVAHAAIFLAHHGVERATVSIQDGDLRIKPNIQVAI